MNFGGRMSQFQSTGRRANLAAKSVFLIALAAVSSVGCTGFQFMFGPIPAPTDTSNTDLALAIDVAIPSETVTAALGAPNTIQWSDIAKLSGTTVRVDAQRQDDAGVNIGDPLHLVGNGTTGSGRDALADGASDQFDWDITGVRVGDYVIIATIDSPDGESITIASRDLLRNTTGIMRVTTALPVPTFNFTAPGAADVTVTTGNTTTITWTDNGTSNDQALVRLALDPDGDRTNGNEITLLRDQPLNVDGTAGQFVFNFLDEAGNAVPLGTYTVFAVVDDNANDPVTVAATGKLIAAP